MSELQTQGLFWDSVTYSEPGWPLYLENLGIPGIYFTSGKAPGKLSFWGNTPGNTWKNISLL